LLRPYRRVPFEEAASFKCPYDENGKRLVGAVSTTGKTPMYSGQADCWLYDKDVNSKVVVRVHKRPRFRLFTPTGFAKRDCPIDPDKLLQ